MTIREYSRIRYRQTLIAIIDNLRRAESEYFDNLKIGEMEWIDVKDRLPEKGNRVLVYGKETGIMSVVAHLSVKGNWNDAACNELLAAKYITHWQPLPQTP